MAGRAPLLDDESPPIMIAALPFAADFAQAVGAHLELVAQPLENGVGRVLIAVGLDGAGNVVGPLPLSAVIDEEILFLDSLQLRQRFGLYARPK